MSSHALISPTVLAFIDTLTAITAALLIAVRAVAVLAGLPAVIDPAAAFRVMVDQAPAGFDIRSLGVVVDTPSLGESAGVRIGGPASAEQGRIYVVVSEPKVNGNGRQSVEIRTRTPGRSAGPTHLYVRLCEADASVLTALANGARIKLSITRMGAGGSTQPLELSITQPFTELEVHP